MLSEMRWGSRASPTEDPRRRDRYHRGDGRREVDAHQRQALDEGAHVIYSPTDQPYGYREYSARDPEGGLWSFMKPLGSTIGIR